MNSENIEFALQKMTLNPRILDSQATLEIPFDSLEHANIAYRVLNVDKEPKRNFVQKVLELKNNILIVHFTADLPKNLRTAITSFFEALFLCQETLKEFGSS